MEITKEYYVCSNKSKDKFIDNFFSFNRDIQNAIRFTNKEHCGEWMRFNEIKDSQPLKIVATFKFE